MVDARDQSGDRVAIVLIVVEVLSVESFLLKCHLAVVVLGQVFQVHLLDQSLPVHLQLLLMVHFVL